MKTISDRLQPEAYRLLNDSQLATGAQVLLPAGEQQVYPCCSTIDSRPAHQSVQRHMCPTIKAPSRFSSLGMERR